MGVLWVRLWFLFPRSKARLRIRQEMRSISRLPGLRIMFWTTSLQNLRKSLSKSRVRLWLPANIFWKTKMNWNFDWANRRKIKNCKIGEFKIKILTRLRRHRVRESSRYRRSRLTGIPIDSLWLPATVPKCHRLPSSRTTPTCRRSTRFN